MSRELRSPMPPLTACPGLPRRASRHVVRLPLPAAAAAARHRSRAVIRYRPHYSRRRRHTASTTAAGILPLCYMASSSTNCRIAGEATATTPVAGTAGLGHATRRSLRLAICLARPLLPHTGHRHVNAFGTEPHARRRPVTSPCLRH